MVASSSTRPPMSPAAWKFVQRALVLVGVVLLAYAFSDHPLYGGEPGFGRTQLVIAIAGGILTVAPWVLPRAWAARLLLLTLVSVATLLFAECAGEFVLGPRDRPIYRADDKVIFAFIPGRTSVMTHAEVNGGETVRHQINNAGFRGPELRSPGEVNRVVVYGDSFVHGYYTSLEQTFVNQLGQQLEQRLGRSIEVINAGVSSYGPDQELVKMRDELPELAPDVVVVTIFAGNDYGDLLRNKMFRLDEAGNLVPNDWRLDDQVAQQLELSQRESILKRALSRLTGAAAATGGGGGIDLDALLTTAQQEYQSHVIDRDPVVTNTHVDYYSADVSLTPNSESARYKVALMQAVLQAIAAETKARDIPTAFVFVPHPGDLSTEYDWPKVDRQRFPDYDGRNQIRGLEQVAEAHGWTYVSLYDPFRANDPNSLYLHGGDDHWNAAGQALAADLVATKLVDAGLLR